MIDAEHFCPVPKVFWSFETGELFQNCAICDAELLKPGQNYLIEKAFRKEETLFEYAMCFDCYEDLGQSISDQSRKLIFHYLDEYVDMDQRLDSLLVKYGTQYKHWLSHCLIKGTPAEDCDEYQICGQCVDRDLVFLGMPFMLSGQAMEEIMNLMSDETKGVLDDFCDKVTGLDLPEGFVII